MFKAEAPLFTGQAPLKSGFETFISAQIYNKEKLFSGIS